MELTIYKPASLLRVPASDALSVLKEHGRFEVFLEFTDPRTDCLVQGRFEFYPEPQKTPSYPWSFLAEHKGLPLRIPADMAWYAKNQNKRVAISQETSVLKHGKYVQVRFDLDITASIRVADAEVAKH